MKRPNLEERELIYRQLLIYVRSSAMLISDVTNDSFAKEEAMNIMNVIETTLRKADGRYRIKYSINDEWDAYFDNLWYGKDELGLKRGRKNAR